MTGLYPPDEEEDRALPDATHRPASPAESDWEDSAGRALVALQDGLQLLAAAFTEMQAERESLRARVSELAITNEAAQADLDRHAAFAERVAAIAMLAEQLGLATELPPGTLSELRAGADPSDPPFASVTGAAAAATDPEPVPSEPGSNPDGAPWLYGAAAASTAQPAWPAPEPTAAELSTSEQLKALLAESEREAGGSAAVGTTTVVGAAYAGAERDASSAITPDEAATGANGLSGVARWANRALFVVALVMLVAAVAIVVVPWVLPLDIRAAGSAAMEPAVPSHALVISRRVDAGRVASGRIISFEAPDGSGFVMRRVVGAEQGPTSVVLVTKADANPEVDPWRLPAVGNVWRFLFYIPFVGSFLEGFESGAGRAFLLVVPAVVLLLTAVVEYRSRRE